MRDSKKNNKKKKEIQITEVEPQKKEGQEKKEKIISRYLKK